MQRLECDLTFADGVALHLRGQIVSLTNSSTVLQAIVSLESRFFEDLISTLRA
jgi:hypothetical protein